MCPGQSNSEERPERMERSFDPACLLLFVDTLRCEVNFIWTKDALATGTPACLPLMIGGGGSVTGSFSLPPPLATLPTHPHPPVSLQVNCNGFTIEDEELSHLGSAIFPE